MSDQPAPTSAVVPAVGAASSATVVRTLGRRGVSPVAVSELPAPPTFASRYCAERISAPDPTTDIDGYRDALYDLASREGVGAIFPMREEDVFALASDRERFAAQLTPLWPSFDALATVHDRERLFAAAERAGVSTPETRRLPDAVSWDTDRVIKARFPLLTATYLDDASVDLSHAGAETPETLSGRCVPATGLRIVDSGEQLDVAEIVAEMGHVPIVQEYVDGAEYCFRALYHDGRPVATSQKRLLRGYKYARGPSVYHRAVDLPELATVGRDLLDELDWNGIASVGFVRDEDGTFRLLEVNPRYPASIPVDVHAGIDYPWLFWQCATEAAESSVSAGDEDRRSPIRDAAEPATQRYQPGVASHLLRGELVHLHSVLAEEYTPVDRPALLGTLLDTATSLFRNPRFDYLSLDDPRPFLRDAADAVRGLGED
jgi:predicted ATP-grasp superfamily ATP-dependent carboligase